MNPEAEEYLNKVMKPLLDPNSINDEAFPLWVRNIIKHFHLTGVKKLFDAISNEDFGSHGIGLMAGSEFGLKQPFGVTEVFQSRYNHLKIQGGYRRGV